MGQLWALLEGIWPVLTIALIGLVIVGEEIGRINRDGW